VKLRQLALALKRRCRFDEGAWISRVLNAGFSTWIRWDEGVTADDDWFLCKTSCNSQVGVNVLLTTADAGASLTGQKLLTFPVISESNLTPRVENSGRANFSGRRIWRSFFWRGAVVNFSVIHFSGRRIWRSSFWRGAVVNFSVIHFSSRRIWRSCFWRGAVVNFSVTHFSSVGKRFGPRLVPFRMLVSSDFRALKDATISCRDCKWGWAWYNFQRDRAIPVKSSGNSMASCGTCCSAKSTIADCNSNALFLHSSHFSSAQYHPLQSALDSACEWFSKHNSLRRSKKIGDPSFIGVIYDKTDMAREIRWSRTVRSQQRFGGYFKIKRKASQRASAVLNLPKSWPFK